MSCDEFVARLRAGGDPLHLMAAEALVSLCDSADRLQERDYQLGAIHRARAARMNSDAWARAAAPSERISELMDDIPGWVTFAPESADQLRQTGELLQQAAILLEQVQANSSARS